MRRWKLTPEEEAEVLERYDQSTPEIKRGIALELAKRAIEGAVLVRKFQAALDAERAKVARLVAALTPFAEYARNHLDNGYDAAMNVGYFSRPGITVGDLRAACAAIRAAKEGAGLVQPDTTAMRAALEKIANYPPHRNLAVQELKAIAEAALRAAKGGTGPVQPDVRQWAADELIRITAESVDLPSPTDANWLRGKMLQVSLALEDGVIPVAEANVQPKQSGLSGEGTVPT